jgi:hypothetical protein
MTGSAGPDLPPEIFDIPVLLEMNVHRHPGRLHHPFPERQRRILQICLQSSHPAPGTNQSVCQNRRPISAIHGRRMQLLESQSVMS